MPTVYPNTARYLASSSFEAFMAAFFRSILPLVGIKTDGSNVALLNLPIFADDFDDWLSVGRGSDILDGLETYEEGDRWLPYTAAQLAALRADPMTVLENFILLNDGESLIYGVEGIYDWLRSLPVLAGPVADQVAAGAYDFSYNVTDRRQLWHLYGTDEFAISEMVDFLKTLWSPEAAVGTLPYSSEEANTDFAVLPDLSVLKQRFNKSSSRVMDYDSRDVARSHPAGVSAVVPADMTGANRAAMLSSMRRYTRPTVDDKIATLMIGSGPNGNNYDDGVFGRFLDDYGSSGPLAARLSTFFDSGNLQPNSFAEFYNSWASTTTYDIPPSLHRWCEIEGPLGTAAPILSSSVDARVAYFCDLLTIIFSHYSVSTIVFLPFG